MSNAPPLQISNLVKRFGGLTAVEGVSLEVRDRECVGLLGPNGAGKSTTIRSIVGRVRPDAGTVRIFGHPAESAEARAAIGWVPQELALYPLLTCRENLDSFGRYQGLSGKGLHDAIAWCIQWATLADKADTRRDEATPKHGMRADPSPARRTAGRTHGGRRSAIA